MPTLPATHTREEEEDTMAEVAEVPAVVATTEDPLVAMKRFIDGLKAEDAHCASEIERLKARRKEIKGVLPAKRRPRKPKAEGEAAKPKAPKAKK